ncbi:hypothetical protein RHSIM_Rhsim08G0006200 [Rhododendron simsii]|uniref:Uncharacterized protein n=1 Tax=Rhododendron simsii TaxID=118357 RepID=A0A834GQ21_RHOSS|nr:hypothetical protein RHSIM_Rhsim08G0006200 [Rhododendron simsii]
MCTPCAFPKAVCIGCVGLAFVWSPRLDSLPAPSASLVPRHTFYNYGRAKCSTYLNEWGSEDASLNQGSSKENERTTRRKRIREKHRDGNVAIVQSRTETERPWFLLLCGTYNATSAHKSSSSSRFAMSSVLCFPPYCAPKLKVGIVRGLYSSSLSSSSFRVRVKASSCPIDEPILKEALKEPVAFMGGIFAGLLRLDLNEDPLKEWVARTVEASGITAEEIATEKSESEEGSPQQIEIE